MSGVMTLSGGIDSVVTAAYMKNQGVDLHAILFNYGQKAFRRELDAFKYFTDYLGISSYETVSIPFTQKLSHPHISSGEEVSYVDEKLLSDRNRYLAVAQTDFVPLRNLTFAVLAGIYAESVGAQRIFFGFNADSTVETCPDATAEFLERLNQVLELSIMGGEAPRVEAPLIHLTKERIIQLGRQLDVPLKSTYSCFRGAKLHCGRCESCVKRKRAFLDVNVPDRTEYER